MEVVSEKWRFSPIDRMTQDVIIPCRDGGRFRGACAKDL